MKTRFILIQTSHAGNVGAVARAMKTMGFDDLVLVAPRWPNVLRKEETIQRASGALDVLANARIVATLDEALDGISHLCATAMTPRDFGPPTRTPREHFDLLLKGELCALDGRAQEANFADKTHALNRAADPHPSPLPGGEGVKPAQPVALAPLGRGRGEGHLRHVPSHASSNQGISSESGVAFLFGSERFGMANEDVYRCHVALSIPTNPQFGSLNLGAAVQVIAYEWRQALGGYGVPESAPQGERADAAQLAGMLAHWEQALAAIGFLDPAAPKKLMPRLNQMFNRAALTQEEIHILRGVAKSMLQAARANR